MGGARFSGQSCPRANEFGARQASRCPVTGSMGPSRRSHKPLRRIAFNAVAVGLVVAMVIARMRSASGPSRVDAFDTAGPEPVEEQSPWCELRGRMLKLPRKERGVRAVVVAFALTIAGAAGIIASGKVL